MSAHDEDKLHPHLKAKSGFGALSSVEAQKYFRETILAKAICPICGNIGFEHLHLSGEQGDGKTDELTFGLPVIVPHRIDLVPVGALQVGMCPNCGYLAQFMDLAIQGRYENRKEVD